jgi:hypothetical protein
MRFHVLSLPHTVTSPPQMAATQFISLTAQVVLPFKKGRKMAHFAELDENNIVTQVLVVHDNELLVDGV